MDNTKKCSRFERCNKNFCPLDPELNLRSGKKQDKCPFSRETKSAKIKEREFVSGGRVMPTVPLNFVPESNLESLNKASKAKWLELKNNQQKNGE